MAPLLGNRWKFLVESIDNRDPYQSEQGGEHESLDAPQSCICCIGLEE